MYVFSYRLDIGDECAGTQGFPSSPTGSCCLEKTGGESWRRPSPLKGATQRSRTQPGRVARPCSDCRTADCTACECAASAPQPDHASPSTACHRQYPFFLSYVYLHLVWHCHLSFRAASRVLRALSLLAVGMISWVPHFTTGIEWALRVGLHCLQQAPHPLDEPWVCIADFTIQIGSKKALIVLRVP